MIDVQVAQIALGVSFKNIELLQTALTHRSYLNESHGILHEHNERLEFLGDAVLEILVSEYLFKTYPQLREGDLTAYRSATVRMESLADTSLQLGIGEYIQMSKGEEMTGGRQRPYILANTFEAFLGALFIDQGLESCKSFLIANFFEKIARIIEDEEYIDSKSKLQEFTQERFKQMPVYRLLKEEGPDHDKTFTVEVCLKESTLGSGTGKSKQQAQQEAARDALKRLI